MKANTFLFVIMLCISSSGYCHAAAGANPWHFLFMDAEARTVALGGSGTALTQDSRALHYNPAGLGRAQQNEASFSHNSHVAGITQEFAGLCLRSGLGMEVNYVNYGRLSRTTVSHPDGGQGDFTAWDLAMSAGYGGQVSETVSIGAGLKFIKSVIDDVSAQGYAVDAGVLYQKPNSPTSIGASIQNLGPRIKYQKTEEDLPLNVRVGGAYIVSIVGQKATIALDMSNARDEDPVFSLGTEILMAKVLAMRLGYTTRNTAGPGASMGLGLAISTFGIDYALVPFGALGSAHRLSCSVKW